MAGQRLCGEREIEAMLNAYSISVSGVVQGVGFRPFVYRLARAHDLKGWVLNAEKGVEIHLEGEERPKSSWMQFSHTDKSGEIRQLHELRSSLQRYSKSALRSPQNHNGRLATG